VRPGHIAAIHVDPALWSSQDLWEHFEDRDVYRLEPGAFLLACGGSLRRALSV
jgi:hypothetical protein